LGANEAPPAIISVFVGTQLTKTLENLEKKEKITHEIEKEISLSIPKIPEILLDNTDRNRTSPFAFTGNKFEFRAVGSSANCAAAMIALNTIIADQLIKFKNDVEQLIVKKIPKEDAIMQVIKKYNKESKNVRFEGNNYSEEWLVEAKKRGLSNVLDTPNALKAFVTPKTIKLFSDNNILSKRELEARQEIKLENYIKKIQIEARVIGDIAINHIIPVAIKYQNVLLINTKGMKDVLDAKTYKKLAANQLLAIKEISEHIIQIMSKVDQMIEERKKCNLIEHAEKKAIAYNKKVLPYFESIRYHADKLEFLIDDELWPLPKYRELLFSK
jgi:glutamine synthetase